jgi:hypothetical protein
MALESRGPLNTNGVGNDQVRAHQRPLGGPESLFGRHDHERVRRNDLAAFAAFHKSLNPIQHLVFPSVVSMGTCRQSDTRAAAEVGIIRIGSGRQFPRKKERDQSARVEGSFTKGFDLPAGLIHIETVHRRVGHPAKLTLIEWAFGVPMAALPHALFQMAKVHFGVSPGIPHQIEPIPSFHSIFPLATEHRVHLSRKKIRKGIDPDGKGNGEQNHFRFCQKSGGGLGCQSPNGF